jgi:ATP-dependent helicase/nuclease subunit B
VLRALGSPYFDFCLPSGEQIDTQNLLSVLLRYSPSGDLAGWSRTIASHLEGVRAKIEESDDPDEVEHLQREAARLERARRDLGHVRSMLAPFAGPMTPHAFVGNLRTLIEHMGVRRCVLASSRETIRAAHLDRDTRAYRAIVKLVEELESLFRLLGIEHELRPLTFYVERLKSASIWTRFSGRPRSGAVLVTPLTQAVASPADYLFIAGLSEGALPAAYQPQVFLMDSYQRGEQKQLREDRVLFYQALSHARKQLVLSVPLRTAGGAELSRSIFLDALSEVLKWEALPTAEGVFSWRDLHERAGEIAKNDPGWLEKIESAITEIDAQSESIATLRDQVPRVLAAEQMRAASDDSIYRGRLDLAELSDRERQALEDNRTRVWSVTQLELYAGCPFKYFAQRVLLLGKEEEREDGLDARERGSALHEILRDFLTTRRERKRPWIQDLPEQEIESAYQDLRDTAERHFAAVAAQYPGHAEHPFWRLDRERLLADAGPTENVLRRFVRREHQLARYEQRPAFFEVSFGTELKRAAGSAAGSIAGAAYDPELSRDEPVTIGGVRLRGRIDRIDRSDDTFAIVDYKSGKEIPPFRSIERGISLQLPLYLRVAEDLLRSHFPELQGVAALYYRLMVVDSRRTGTTGHPRELGLAVREFMDRSFENLGDRKRGILDTQHDLEELIEQTIAKAQSYVEGVAAGDFHLVSQELAKSQCPNCPYGPVCRVHEAEEFGVLH